MLDFFKELLAASKANALERIKNPVIGAYAFSWVAFNWKSILITIFSEKSIEDKIGWIAQNSDIKTSIGYPAIMTGVILIILPVFSAIVTFAQNRPLSYVIRKNYSRIKLNLLNKIDTEQLRARASIAFNRELANEELTVQQLKAQIQETKDESSSLKENYQSLQAEHSVLQGRLSQTEKMLGDYQEVKNMLNQKTQEASKNFEAFQDTSRKLSDTIQVKHHLETNLNQLKEKLPELFLGVVIHGQEQLNQQFINSIRELNDKPNGD